jgi:uncharacterized protein YbaA (DUF1428 family)
MSDGLCRWIRHSGSDQESQGVPPHCAEFGKVWRDHGALAFRECVADDVKVGKWTSFPRSVKLKRGETVVWSYIVYKSRTHRDRVNAKVMKDPRMTSIMNPKALPFDGKRMIFGGFKVLVEG